MFFRSQKSAHITQLVWRWPKDDKTQNTWQQHRQYRQSACWHTDNRINTNEIKGKGVSYQWSLAGNDPPNELKQHCWSHQDHQNYIHFIFWARRFEMDGLTSLKIDSPIWILSVSISLTIPYQNHWTVTCEAISFHNSLSKSLKCDLLGAISFTIPYQTHWNMSYDG